MSITTPSNNNIEYDDAYVIEERTVKYVEDLEENLVTEIQDNLSLDSLDLSDDEEVHELTKDYDKLKIASEISKRKIDNQGDKRLRNTDFRPKVIKREEVVEDFIRNFFTRYTLSKTLDEFNVIFKNI
jgi:hypothetical protein